MPLPPALAARLAQRGIIPKAKVVTVEEIIAEDYDEGSKENQRVAEKRTISVTALGDYPGCPNKWNVYHDCNEKCAELWGQGKLQPDPMYNAKRARMLRLYPIPDNWKEEYDPGTGRFYYWNVKTDEVSWLSPSHPRAIISPCAARLREEMKRENVKQSQTDKRGKSSGADEDDSDEKGSDDEDEEEDDEDEDAASDDASSEEEEEVRNEKNQRDQRSAREGRVREKEPLDPMDPAAYSEVPRGTWSSGLERNNEATTGVDSTASGPLFQMRPYPSPGAILKANAMAKKKK